MGPEVYQSSQMIAYIGYEEVAGTKAYPIFIAFLRAFGSIRWHHSVMSLAPSLAPLEVWAHWGAPNPWKVCTILEVLEVPYTIHFLELTEVKSSSYLALTPNGRLPAIKDPNSSLILWEVSFSTHRHLALQLTLVLVRRHHTVPY